MLSLHQSFGVEAELWAGGVGLVWSIGDGRSREEWRHSVASQSLLINLLRPLNLWFEATFLRAVNENIKVPDVILEMNSLRDERCSWSINCSAVAAEITICRAEELEIPVP
ncbi:hypothetical protein NC652_019939 [Populus alba x Populus x berolinensis]|nr:hypothetical protein NC652_019939 [Populus alba x Populus x berolinensis]